MNKWISLKDKEPEQYQDVLVSDGKTVGLARMYKNHGKFKWNPGSCVNGHDKELVFNDDDITHWMTLPPSPN